MGLASKICHVFGTLLYSAQQGQGVLLALFVPLNTELATINDNLKGKSCTEM